MYYTGSVIVNKCCPRGNIDTLEAKRGGSVTRWNSMNSTEYDEFKYKCDIRVGKRGRGVDASPGLTRFYHTALQALLRGTQKRLNPRRLRSAVTL